MAIVMASSTACVPRGPYVFELKRQDVGIPAGPRIDLNVLLVIDEGLTGAQWKQGERNHATTLRIGDVLANSAETLADHLFAKVRVIARPDQKPVDALFDAILIPRLVTVTRGLTAGREETLTGVLEWSLLDDAGKLVWADTVVGEGTSRASRYWNEPAKELGLRMLEDVFSKSHHILSSSAEIRSYADKARR